VTPPLAHEAIVLRTRPYGESDLIVTFLTDEAGKLTGIAKGAKNSRRRFANCLHPLSRVRVHYRLRPQRSLVFMESCDLRQPATAFALPNKLAYGHYLIELADHFSLEGQPVPELFTLLNCGLDCLLSGPATAGFLRAFEIQLLCSSGYEPDLTACKVCRAPVAGAESVWFDAERGAPICLQCQQHASRTALRIAAATLELLDSLKHMPLSEAQRTTVPPERRREANDIVSRLLAPHLRRPLASLQLLAQLATKNH
jgi:DNA repair protein RecO (recombination protein O)